MFRTDLIGLAVALACGVITGPITEARADALVIASKAAIRVGSTLPDDKVLELQSGQSVTVLLTDGRTRTIEGPFSAPVASFSKGRPADEALWTSVVASLRRAAPSKRTGNVHARKRETGGSYPSGARSYARAPSSPAPAPAAVSERAAVFSWKQIPIDAEGDYCIGKGSGLVLARLVDKEMQPATVIDVRAGARAQVIFAAGNTTAVWPATIVVKTGPYALQLPEKPPRQVRLRVIDPLPQADETLRLLHSQRCQAQIDAWLRGVATASR